MFGYLTDGIGEVILRNELAEVALRRGFKGNAVSDIYISRINNAEGDKAVANLRQ